MQSILISALLVASAAMAAPTPQLEAGVVPSTEKSALSPGVQDALEKCTNTMSTYITVHDVTFADDTLSLTVKNQNFEDEMRCSFAAPGPITTNLYCAADSTNEHLTGIVLEKFDQEQGIIRVSQSWRCDNDTPQQMEMYKFTIIADGIMTPCGDGGCYDDTELEIIEYQSTGSAFPISG